MALHRPMRKNRSMKMKLGVVGVAVLLAACSSTKNHAPVEDRVVRPPAAVAPPPPTVVEAPKVLPGAENNGKAGYYTVKPGDTLIRIGLDNGQNWKDLVKWNNIENPNVIETGQVLRVVPPGVDPNAAGTRPVTTAKVETRPLDAKAAAAAASGAASGAVASAPASAPAPPPAREADDDINWMWPANGTVAAGFDEARSKGLAITGKAGDPVYAAADG